MTNDALSPFVDAYRAEHTARSLDQRALRRRIVAAASRGRLLRAERVRWLIPLAATFAGSVALAATPIVRENARSALSFVERSILSAASGRAPTSTGPHRGKQHGEARAAGPPVARPAAAPPSAVATPASPNALNAPIEARSIASLPIEPAPTRPAPPVRAEESQAAEHPATTRASAAPSADLALYHRAHALHFGGADCSRTLAAWDAYLWAFPRGVFAPEARLNRAVCLAQLGRKAEAEGALSDIERGRFGKDGRRQARKILEALDGGD